MSTKTSGFGSSKRESHNSSEFYGRRMMKSEVSADSTVNKAGLLNHFFCHGSEEMRELPDNSVALVVTSPPYNVGKEYDEDLEFESYIGLLSKVFTEVYRVLEPGGRVCVNVANVGRKPYIPLTTHLNVLMSEIGFFMRGEIICMKGKGASGSCAWGSWCSAKNPVLRDLHEYVLVYCKGRFDRAYKGESTIGKEEFMSDTLSIWEIKPESARKVGHPAPFPVELPHRLIELYTYEGDLVLDPFCGSGTTCIAASGIDRRWVGYDIKPAYIELANKRMIAFLRRSWWKLWEEEKK